VCDDERTSPLFTKRGFTFVRCACCGLVSIRPLPGPAELKAHHDASYRDGGYASFAAADDMRVVIARHRLARVRALAASGAWLDVGCSTGAFIAEAVAAGFDAEGLELSSVAASAACARGLRVHEAAAEEFQPTRRYAVVTAFDVIEHLRDPVALVERVATWLADEGIFVATLPDIASVPARLLGRHWFYYAPPDHIHYFMPATVRRLLGRAGFGHVEVRRALKPLTVDYATGALARLVPALGAPAAIVCRLVPQALRSRAVPFPLGEMFVTARPSAA
jgi:SAM-dependent methyltransferase